jgi:hypothetical protein
VEEKNSQPFEAAHILCPTYAALGSATSFFEAGRQAALEETATLESGVKPSHSKAWPSLLSLHARKQPGSHDEFAF